MSAGTVRALLLVAAFSLFPLLGACEDGGEESPEVEAVLELDRGVRLLEDGHFEQAYRVFDSVVRKEPRNAEAYARRGFARLALGDMTGGLADVNRALEIDPDYALAHNYKGVLFAMNGIEDQAILEFTRAVELAPGLTDAYANRGRIYLQMSDGESALADLDTALSLEPESAELLLTRAQIHLILGNTGRAEADLERVLSLPVDEAALSAARLILSRIR